MVAPASEDESKDVDAFLSSCAASGEAAYAAADAVLDRLQARASRAAARRLLGAVRRRFDAGQEHCFLTLHFVDPHLQGFQQSTKLTMMEIPSIFTPEDWSFAFYEGLNQHQDSTSRDKTYAELGCGNGWIPLG